MIRRLLPLARLVCLALAALPVAAHAAAGADAVATVLEQSIATLDATGRLDVDGVDLVPSPLVAGFYRRRAFAPAWSDGAGVDELVAAIGDAQAQGLDPADYHLEAIVAHRRDHDGSAREAGAFDLLLSDAFVRLAEDVRYGKIRARAITSTDLRAHALRSVDPVADLLAAVDDGRVLAFVESLQPDAVLYRRLRTALAEYRRLAAAGGWAPVATGPTLKPGAVDPRAGALRERLAVTGDLPKDAEREAGDSYDGALVAGVRAFQSRHGLDADGVLGPGTVAALNVPVAARVEQIRATLERCRWYLRDLPDRFVMVNIAGYRVLLVDGGQVAWRSRAIVGQPFLQTPVFRANLQYVVLNPTWTVPESIVKKEILPALRSDPHWLAKKRIEKIDGEYVQRPGEENSLGRIKLMMPNIYSVYLHDTPSRSLFGRSARAFSHGCIRVEKPVELAALVLDDPAWGVEQLGAAIATGVTRDVRLRKPVAVFVMYWSVTVNDEGVVEFLPDVYHSDEDVLRGLAAAGR